MSDYGDGNYSDGDYDPWYYIEETYQAADDLAEHAVASPPPIYLDEDQYDDFDLFDFWYDIEEGSDADVEEAEGTLGSKGHSKTGQKRKRGAKTIPGRKRRKVEGGKIQALPVRSTSPTPTVLWLSQSNRDAQRAAKVKFLDDTVKPYALLKDWRELAERSPKGKGLVVHEPEEASEHAVAQSGKGRAASITGPLSPSPELEDDEMQELIATSGIDPGALMTALQNRLADAQGLEGFDRSVLLKYAMRMMVNEDESEDIAGELTEDILGRDDDDPHAAGIASWISQQLGTAEQDEDVEPVGARNDSFADSSTRSPFAIPMSPAVTTAEQHPPTPSSTETANSTTTTAGLGLTATRVGPASLTKATNKKAAAKASKDKEASKASAALNTSDATPQPPTRKRKAHADDAETTEPAPEPKRAARGARSYNAPTAASQARSTAPDASTSKTTRSGRARRG
ncbi:uncharacterized protein BDZ99DRAFT_573054 [Mytilinidion resinicola]|uniref:Uncharacterized protein n=1 Tax=Mytilinidion resinicola TaxID=574789 RepID=A0A6A6YEY5_9PEZI|nr:uncharacterized protein BDZ99DRAFT_573054 [Mytilinidion resinicola]KAF2807169.1 hypothetical protein BDZ99DRAFT_573054 [Mytilinidion resinicola]